MQLGGLLFIYHYVSKNHSYAIIKVLMLVHSPFVRSNMFGAPASAKFKFSVFVLFTRRYALYIRRPLIILLAPISTASMMKERYNTKSGQPFGRLPCIQSRAEEATQRIEKRLSFSGKLYTLAHFVYLLFFFTYESCY